MYFLNDQDQQKLELLEMIGRENIPGDNLNNLTETELKWLVSNPRVCVKSCTVDDNGYGEFLFIYFFIGTDQYFVYGLGLHEHRQLVLKTSWTFVYQSCNYRPSFVPIDTATVFKEIKTRKAQIKQLIPTPDEYSNNFNTVADLFDDDVALTYMQEWM
jgi:hypothetical protein